MKGLQILGVRPLLNVQMVIVQMVIAQMFMVAGMVHAEESIGAKFTPRLRALVGQEMRQVSTAMGVIQVAMVQGKHEVVAEQGMRIHNSFIIKQSLTKQDKQDLMAVVPVGFLKLDRQFHGLAKKLAHAATAHDSELQLFYLYRMTATCVACHTTFAKDRFPTLGPRPDIIEHHH